MKKLKLFIFCFLSGISIGVFAADDCIPAKPSPFRLVNNFSKEYPDFISSSDAQKLEAKLRQFNTETSNQIVIVITDELCGYDANEFSTRIGESWGVGQAKFDNGIVILIKPTGGAGQRDAYIAVGYGLEGSIPDITAKHVVSNELIPEFRNGNNYLAFEKATDVLISLAKKEYSYRDYQQAEKDVNWVSLVILLLIFLFVFFISRKKRGYSVTGSGRRYYGGGWGSFGGSGWSSGGGFGGSFGGGSFGGGGAGGKW